MKSGHLCIIFCVLVLFFFGSMIYKEESDKSQAIEMGKLGYCKYKQEGLNPPAYFKCKELVEQ